MKRVILILFLLFAIPCFGANHYIRQGATGSADGSDWTNAWTDLPSTLTRGDTYYFADGNYANWDLDDAVDGTTYIYLKKATISAHGTDTGWSNEYGDGVAYFNELCEFATAYWDVDGVTDYGFAISAITTAYGAIVAYSPGTNVHHIRIRHFEISDNSIGNESTAVYMYSSDSEGSSEDPNVLIENCYFHDQGGLHILCVNGNYWTIQNCKMERCCQYNSEGHKEMIKDNGEDDYWVIRRNQFLDWQGYSVTGGIILSEGQTHWDIYDNLFYWTTDNASMNGGNRAIGGLDSGSGGYSYIRVYNNTFYNIHDTSAANILSDFGDWTTGNNTAYNNLWYNCDGLNAVCNETGTTGDYNWYYDTPNYSTRQTNDVSGTADPFTAAETYDFTLNTTAGGGITARDAGKDLSTIFTTDYAGKTMGLGDGWPIGAYEYTPEASSDTPYSLGGCSISGGGM